MSEVEADKKLRADPKITRAIAQVSPFAALYGGRLSLERLAELICESQGFGYYTDPMEGGRAAYDISRQADYQASVLLPLIMRDLPQPGAERRAVTEAVMQLWRGMSDQDYDALVQRFRDSATHYVAMHDDPEVDETTVAENGLEWIRREIASRLLLAGWLPPPHVVSSIRPDVGLGRLYHELFSDQGAVTLSVIQSFVDRNVKPEPQDGGVAAARAIMGYLQDVVLDDIVSEPLADLDATKLDDNGHVVAAELSLDQLMATLAALHVAFVRGMPQYTHTSIYRKAHAALAELRDRASGVDWAKARDTVAQMHGKTKGVEWLPDWQNPDVVKAKTLTAEETQATEVRQAKRFAKLSHLHVSALAAVHRYANAAGMTAGTDVVDWFDRQTLLSSRLITEDDVARRETT